MSSRHHANDNFVEQLLKGGTDASGLEPGEEEAEEVDYSETDEEIRAAQGHGHADRGRHVGRSPAGQGKHNPISWRDWQAPEQLRRSSRSRGRDPGLRRYREPHLPPGYPDRAQYDEYAREHADRARCRGERGTAPPAPHREEEDLLMRLRHERGHASGEALRSRPAPHDRHWDIPYDPWESARPRHPGDFHVIDGWLSAHGERSRAFASPLPARSPPPPPVQRHTVMAHPHNRSPLFAHTGFLSPQRDYANDRLPHRHSILLQRGRPEEERLIIRRPLSPERLSQPETWYPAEYMNGGTHAAARRVEYDHHPVPSYRPAHNHTARRDRLRELPLDRDPYWHLSPDAPHRTESLLRGARGATPPRGREPRAPALSRAPRRMPHGRERISKRHRSASVTTAAAPSDVCHVPPGLLPEQLPGPPVLPGPPPVPEQKQQHELHLSDASPAGGVQHAPTAQHMNGSHEQELQHSQAANERAESGHSNSAPSYGVVDAGKALETFGEIAAGGAFEDERHEQSKRQKVEAEGQTDTSAAPKAVVMHASASIQGVDSSEHGKDVIAASRGAAKVEDGTEAQARPARSLSIQGYVAPEDRQPTHVNMPDKDTSPAEASKPGSAHKGGPKSTFVRDFYSRPERSASSRSTERKHRQLHKQAHGSGKASSHEANGHARSSEEMRGTPTPATTRRDPLKELRERRGVKGLRKLKIRRDSPRQVSSSSRDAKASRRGALQSWHGDKPEDVEEWSYLDPSGKLQGPCSIASFRLWLARMKENPALSVEHEEFLKCMVWRKGMNRREPLEKLLAVADAEAAKWPH